MKQRVVAFLLIVMLLAVGAASAQDGARPEREERALPAGLAELRLDQPVSVDDFSLGAIDASLVGTEGEERVIIRLATPSVAEQKVRGKSAENAKRELQSEQQDLLALVQSLDPNARVLAQVQLVLNAVFVEVDAAVLPQIAANPGVLRISKVHDYELDLSETVPYIGAAAVQGRGYDGSGIRVAVLDSGIDYTHADLGGSGDPADYAANDPTIIEPGTFPTAKVVGGFDFVGSNWSGGPGTPPEAPDPDPLDDGPEAGHGTHVGHIIGGVGGVAPAVDLYAVKVCSSVSTSCSGIALIQGMEFVVDPDGDGDTSDAMDIVNMSLGASYGHRVRRRPVAGRRERLVCSAS
jgi:subtilisin family serine protease